MMIRLCAFTLLLSASAAPAMVSAEQSRGSDRPVATRSSECAQASRAFSQTRYDEAVARWERTFAKNPKMLKARKDQEHQSWRVRRYEQNVKKCQAWFARGRTAPYTPG